VRLLERCGHTVCCVTNGRDAVLASDRTQFDVILMDGQMPGMDGMEATAAIRERERATGRHVPIIALTAHAMRGDRQRFLASGMDGYASKPIQIEELLRSIEAVVPAIPVSEPTVSS
jgi:two-component system, sensor histidine kinase and response regulator